MPLVGDRRIWCQFYSSAIHTLKITNTSQGLRLIRSRLTKSSPISAHESSLKLTKEELVINCTGGDDNVNMHGTQASMNPEFTNLKNELPNLKRLSRIEEQKRYLMIRQIIDSGSPLSLDLHHNIPSTFQDFILEMEQFCIQQLAADLKQFDCKIGGSGGLDLLSLAWVVAIIQPRTRPYVMQMLKDTKIEQLVDKCSLRAFARQFDACCLKITALHVPGNQASVFLDKASVAMDYSGRLWALLMDLEIRVDGVGCGTAICAAVITLRELVQSVHSYKVYHAVSRHVKGNLIQCVKLVERKLSVASLQLRAGRDNVALQEAWEQLKREFYITDACVLRRALWDSARLLHCSYDQCANTTTDILSVWPPRSNGSAKAIHWRECRGIASMIHEHPIYGQPRGEHIIPSINLAYIQDMASVAIQIARDHGDLSDMPTLGEYEIMLQENALEDEEMVDKEHMELMIMDTNVSFCSRVPLCRESRTLVVCMDHQFVRDNGTIMDREDIVQSFRRMWSQEYSKQHLQT
ncbi:hypothetical protein BT96DRAFT_943383 [Gymnopus androsaceus JB14]|uniref:Uncharacterized protein n=1 Tax=Gymnopus androsaceus JB14 TaxID=1447944 RepID=A0A6A4H8N6_9AGAR|nr:hypothetical protein BT96DRAFT_943383 [Gymnopus androsaceus JB14]